MENLNVEAKSENGKLTVLKGEAPAQTPLFRNREYNFIGGPGTVLEIVSKEPIKSIIEDRVDEHNDIFLNIDRDHFKMVLIINSCFSSITDRYSSALVVSKEIKDLGINTDKTYTTFDLANMFKMNRTLFETKSKAMEIVSLLRNFKAKVDKDIENEDDTRGNRKMLIQQKVDSNIPESFKLTLPIFKGIDPQTIEVEIMIDATDFSCQLVSPEAKDFIDSQARDIMEEELSNIKSMHPNLKIIELI